MTNFPRASSYVRYDSDVMRKSSDKTQIWTRFVSTLSTSPPGFSMMGQESGTEGDNELQFVLHKRLVVVFVSDVKRVHA